jgi:hypothetical protein
MDAAAHLDEESIEIGTPVWGGRNQTIHYFTRLLGKYETRATLRFFAPLYDKRHPPIFFDGGGRREGRGVIVIASKSFWFISLICRIILLKFCNYLNYRLGLGPIRAARL